MKSFFKTPTKLALLAILAGWLVITASSVPAVADEERDPLMDLQRGGADFFIEIVPSIVQIYNGGVYAGEQGGAGSGYIIDREGTIITNKHVADAAPVLEISFFGDETEARSNLNARFPATLIGEDPALDLAVIQVHAPADRFHPVRLGDSALIAPGDMCATLGSPGGDAGIVDRSISLNFEDSWLEFYNLNLGIISEVLDFEEAFLFYRDYWTYERTSIKDYGSAVEYLFHPDAAINHGNSGGPCLNMYGEAVGTNTWGFGTGNLGFSVPVNLLKEAVVDILEYGRPRRTWLGVSLHPSRAPQGELDRAWRTETMPYTGVLWFDSTPETLDIYFVNPYSPAYEAGLREGDTILRVDGEEFENVFNVYSYIMDKEIGDEIVIEYERDGMQMPPAFITTAEKVTRYHGTQVDVYARGARSGDWTRYASELTY